MNYSKYKDFAIESEDDYDRDDEVVDWFGKDFKGFSYTVKPLYLGGLLDFTSMQEGGFGAGLTPNVMNVQMMWAICFNGFMYDIVAYSGSAVAGAFQTLQPVPTWSSCDPKLQMKYVQPGTDQPLGVVSTVGDPQSVISGVNGLLFETSNGQTHWGDSIDLEFVPATGGGGPFVDPSAKSNNPFQGPTMTTRYDLYWATNDYLIQLQKPSNPEENANPVLSQTTIGYDYLSNFKKYYHYNPYTDKKINIKNPCSLTTGPKTSI